MHSILITGSAGFIGANLVMRLLRDMTEGTIIGLDNLNSYYDPSLKKHRLQEIEKNCQLSTVNYQFIKGSIADRDLVNRLFAEYKFDIVVNLAAQAGVRHSIDNPDAYIESNIIGFYNILEACRHAKELVREHEKKTVNCQLSTVNYQGVQHLVFASSSSVYGGNSKIPFAETDRVDHPVSLYAATKKSNELMAHTYSKLYGVPCTGLRFFTVYGPAGRPDMAYFGFTNKLLKGEKIQIFNYGNCLRDFTYIDDIVEGIVRVMKAPPKSSPKGKDLGVHTADPMMYKELKQRAEEMRRNPTEAEKVLWNVLRGKGLGVKFRRQHIIEDFIVDFYCNEYKVTVEVDGGYHENPEQLALDAKRTDRLNELGYTELRFSNGEVLLNLDNVLKNIKTFCSGTPSPSGEGWGEAVPPYRLYNIGNSHPENLLEFVDILQQELVRAQLLPDDYDFESHRELVPMQAGDVPVTYADTSALERDYGFKPSTNLREGLRRFVEWYKEFYE